MWTATSKEVDNLKKQLVLQVLAYYHSELITFALAGRAGDEVCREVGSASCCWEGRGDEADTGEHIKHVSVVELNLVHMEIWSQVMLFL